jgi:hypothetical protein
MHPVSKMGDKCRAKCLGAGEIPYPKLDWNPCIRSEMLVTVVNRLVFPPVLFDSDFLGNWGRSLRKTTQAVLGLLQIPAGTRTEPVIGTRIALVLMISIISQWNSPINSVFEQFNTAQPWRRSRFPIAD